MAHITLTEEQLRAIAAADKGIEVRGPANELLGSLTIFTQGEREAIERYKQNRGRDKRPCVSGSQVQAFLQRLNQAAEQGPVTASTVEQLIEQLRAGESR